LAEGHPQFERQWRLAAAGRQPGITSDYTRKTFGKARHQPQADQPAPVLAEQRDVLQVEGEQPFADPVDMTFERIIGPRRRLVRLAEADEIGGQHAMAARRQRRDHVAIEKTPARLAVQQQHRRGSRAVSVSIRSKRGSGFLF
jgi:hypothetical protein